MITNIEKQKNKNQKNIKEEKAGVKIIQEFGKENIKPINAELLRSFRLLLADNGLS